MYRIHRSRPSKTRMLGRRARRGNVGGAAPPAISPGDVSAARALYCDALGGRQLWRAPRWNTVGTLRFLVAGTVVEVRSDFGSAETPITLHVGDPDLLAQRCWDAGFTVRVNQDETERAPVSVIDPFGRRIDLAVEQDQHLRNCAAGVS